MACTARIGITLILVVSISLGFNVLVVQSNDLLTLSHNSSHSGGELSSSLGQNLIFEYNETLLESSLQLSILDLNLSTFSEIQLVFIVNGDLSTKSGLSVVFVINSTEITFLIERIYQDSSIHQIKKGFVLEEKIIGDLNITINFQGIAPSGQSGILTILSDSSFSNLEISAIDEIEKEITVTPNTIAFEGVMLGSKEYRALSVIENDYNDSISCTIIVSFTANDFSSFGKTLNILVNSSEQSSINFYDNTDNLLQTELVLEIGINIVELIFKVDYCPDVIQLSDLILSGYIENTNKDDLYYEFEWINEISELIDISSLKPMSNHSEQILNLSISLSFEGSTVYTGIALHVVQDSIILGTKLISLSKQTSEIQSIIIETYTGNYDEDLFIKLEADFSGTGTIYMYNSTSISIQSIVHIREQKYERVLEEKIEIETSSFGPTVVSFYDVINIEDSSKNYLANITMDLFFFDLNFESLTVSLRVKKIPKMSKIFNNQGHLEISEQISLLNDFNEIEVVISILGNGAAITIENLQYSLLLSTENSQTNNPAEFTDIPFFKTPKNIAVGLFVLFDCWLLMGIILRIYKGHKLRKKQHTENDEFILEIAQLSQD